MKLLKFPQGDITLNRIESIKKSIMEDATGEYVDELLMILLDYLSMYPSDEREMCNAEAHINEARFWLLEYFENEGKEDNGENEETNKCEE